MLKVKEKGFTLIEVLISLAILAIVIIPILSMVLGSVKTNKAGEDKEKTLYIAQQYVEKFKNQDSFLIGEDSDFKDVPDNPDFQYKQTITELDYKFPDKNENSNTNPTFNSIKYDGKIEIDCDSNNILASIKKMNADSSEGDIIDTEKVAILTPEAKPYDNTLEIIDGKNKYDKHEDNKIYIKLSNKDTSTIQEINKDLAIESINEGKKSGYIIISFKGERQSEENIPKIQIKASNYSEESLTIYFAEENKKKVDYNFENHVGKIQVYSNIMVHGKYTNNSRVYKINVEVRKKNGNKESLQKITAYKNVAE